MTQGPVIHKLQNIDMLGHISESKTVMDTDTAQICILGVQRKKENEDIQIQCRDLMEPEDTSPQLFHVD
jgi:hypothetical protein